MGKCPKCEKPVLKANTASIEMSGGFSQPSYRGIKYMCPLCSTVLGVGIDPIALKEDTISGLLKALGKK